MIVVTGGAGFIGSAMLWKLNSEGIRDILVVDELASDEKWRNLVGKRYSDYLEKQDFLQLVLDNKLDKKIKAIIHLGALSATTGTDATYYIKNNYEYTKELAKWCLKNKVRFIYASSGATYGDGELGYSDNDADIPKLVPLNMYGYSKHMFDLWVLKNNVQDKVVGLKYYNVFGPNEYHKDDMRSVIAKQFETILRDKKIRLFKSYRDDYKDGEQKRDFIYVKDAVEATYYFLKNPSIGGIYNIGTGQARTWNDLAKAIFKALDMPINIEYIEMPETLQPKYQYFTEADNKKLRGAGYNKDFTSLEDSVAEYVSFLREHKYL